MTGRKVATALGKSGVIVSVKDGFAIVRLDAPHETYTRVDLLAVTCPATEVWL